MSIPKSILEQTGHSFRDIHKLLVAGGDAVNTDKMAAIHGALVKIEKRIKRLGEKEKE